MINDYFKPQEINGHKLKKLKGHVKLTLKDAETGEVQKVVEGDNIFTNALPDMITQCNYFGCMDYSQILPLWEKWFGGCLLYTDPFPVDEQTEEPDPDDYFIKNDSVNKVIAHAGDVFTSDIRDDPKRGMPNTYLQQRTPQSITMGWQWGPTQGNGQISAISLCHKDVGNCGTGSNSNAFKTLQPFLIANRSNIGVWPVESDSQIANEGREPAMGFLDDHWAVRAWAGTDTQEGSTTRDWEFTSFCIFRAGLKDIGLTDTNIKSERIVSTLYIVDWNWSCYYPAYWFDAENKNLWLFANRYDQFHVNYFWYQKVHFAKNSSGNWAVDSYVYGNVTPNEDIIGNLYEINTLNYKGFNSPIVHQYKILEDNTKQDVFYFPYWDSSRSQTDRRRWVKFNFQNQADYSIVKVNSDASCEKTLRCCMAGNDTDTLLTDFGWVMNSGVGYKCSPQFSETYGGSGVFYTPKVLSPDKVASVGFNAYSSPQNVILINKMLLVTKFNLNDSVMKTASNTMELEYTITEVD